MNYFVGVYSCLCTYMSAHVKKKLKSTYFLKDYPQSAEGIDWKRQDLKLGVLGKHLVLQIRLCNSVKILHNYKTKLN